MKKRIVFRPQISNFPFFNWLKLDKNAKLIRPSASPGCMIAMVKQRRSVPDSLFYSEHFVAYKFLTIFILKTKTDEGR